MNVSWFLQDSLDGRRWHSLADGVLNSATNSSVARISAPVASRMRVAFRAQPMFAYKRTDNNTVQERRICVAEHHDDVHAALRVEMLTINAVIRSI